MKRFLASKYIYLALRLALGGLFIYAGATKLTDTMAFAQVIDAYGLVSWGLAKKLAWGLPIFEIITGLGLVLNVRGALGMIVAQLLGFMLILLYAMHLGLDADCGCFGSGETGSAATSLTEAFVRDLFMLAGCVFMYWQRRVADFRFLFSKK